MALLCPLLCAAKQLRPLVWVLDAGHGGKDQGTSAGKVLEKDLTLKLTNRVAALLRKNRPGIKLVLTRTDDTFVSLEERCRIANNARADLFLSIHINFAERNILLSGTETFYANRRAAQDMVQASHLERNADKSELLAWLLQNSYSQSGRPTDRGAKANNLYVLMHTEMPAVLTEVGFLSNVNDAAYLCSERGQKQVALDIYNALNEYYTTTKAGTHKQTLRRLRQTYGTVSGLKVKRLREDNTPAEVLPVTDPADDEDLLPMPDLDELPQPDVDATDDMAQDVTAQQDEPRQDVPPVIPAQEMTPQETPVQETPKRDEKKAEGTEERTKHSEEKARKAEDERPTFSVQLLAVGKKPREGDPRLKGLSPVRIVQAGQAYKVLYGSTADYQQARATLKRVKDKFPDAFIVAYRGDTPITTAEALRLAR